jgi:hypothetical protein
MKVAVFGTFLAALVLVNGQQVVMINTPCVAVFG